MGFDRILRISPKGLDDNVLFDPSEEDLYVSTVLVDVCDVECDVSIW